MFTLIFCLYLYYSLYLVLIVKMVYCAVYRFYSVDLFGFHDAGASADTSLGTLFWC